MARFAVQLRMKRLILLALPLLAAGCATSSQPLRQNTAAYDGEAASASTAAFPLIAIGATADEVKAQLGEPAHIRAKASGRFLRTTWSYENQGAPGNTVHVTFQRGIVEDVRQESNPPPAPAAAQP